MLDILCFSCPLLLAATGALFTEYTGMLAVFMEGLISLSGFFTYLFTTVTGSLFLGIIISVLVSVLLTTGFACIVEKTKANPFIAAIGMNLFFTGIISFLSSLIFHNRGILTSQRFMFPVKNVEYISVAITFVFILCSILLLKFTQTGSKIRITGTDSYVLKVRGINPDFYRILSWSLAGFFAAGAGTILVLRVSSFVPNISSGKGWMALAAVFMGRKKLWKVALFAVLFCAVDYLSGYIPNFIPSFPTAVLLSMPYIFSIALIAVTK